MPRVYDFAQQKWVDQPANQQPISVVGNSAPLPKLQVVTNPQPQSKIVLNAPLASTPGNLQGTYNPAPKTANPAPKTYNPAPKTASPVKTVQVAPSVPRPTNDLPTQDTGQRLDLNSIKQLYMVSPEGQLVQPKALTPAELKALEISRFSQTATSDLAFGKTDRKAWQKVLGFAMDQVDPLVRDISNIRLSNAIADDVASGKIDSSVYQGIEVLNKTNLQIVGDVAQAVLTVYSPGTVVKNAGSQLLKTGLKQLALQGAKDTSFQGLQFGIAQALSSGSTDPVEISKIIALNTAGGALVGAGANVALPAISKIIAGTIATKQATVQHFIQRGFSEVEAQKLAGQGGFLRLGTTPKIAELESQWQRIQVAKNNATNKKVITRFEKAQKAIEKQIRLEEQAGFVKNPFGKKTENADLPNLKVSPKEDNILTKVRNALKPIKAADPEIQVSYNNWSNSRVAAKELAQKESTNLSHIPGKTGILSKSKGVEGWKTILDYEQGITGKYTDDIAQTFDKLHDEATSRGFEVPYRKNYIPQIYDNTPEEVIEAVARYMKDKDVDPNVITDYLAGKELTNDVATRLKLNPDFTKQRVLPDYKTAMKYGLNPKYTHPAQLAGAYKEGLEKAVANRQLVSDLVNSGQIVSKPRTGYSLVDWPFLGQPMYAKNNLSRALNGAFSDQSGASTGKQLLKSIVSAGGKTSKFMQEIALSAGFPNTDINFFAMGQLIKQATSRTGQIVTQPIRGSIGVTKDIAAFLRANFDSKTIQFFEKKAPIIQKMADNGIDIAARTGNFRDLYKNMVANPKIVKVLGNGWDRLFQKKTFSNFMPQLYINTFEEIYKKGIKQGLDDAAATKLAGNATKAFHGLSDDVARSKTGKDVLATIFFAPKFREGIINTLLNTGKSVTTKVFDKSFSKNRQLLTGMILTFGAYQALNQKLNGHYTWDNEAGKEFSLKIPLPDKKNVMYVEFMPSFLSLPRNLASGSIALSKLDMKTAGQKFSSLLSMPINMASQVISNQDYFGRPIYSETDSKKERLQKIAVHVGLKQTHPYLRLLADYINQDPNDPFQKPLYQSLVEAAEFPLKFNSLDRISRQEFFEASEKAKQRSADEMDRMRPFYDQMQKLKAEGKVEQANSQVRALSKEDQEVYKKLKTSDTRTETNENKQQMFNFFKEMQELKSQGRTDEANNRVRGLSPEDQKAYKLLKESELGKEVMREVESKTQKTSLLPNIIKSASASETDMSAQKFEKLPEVSTSPYQSVSSLNTDNLDKTYANGSDGGWCGEFVKKIVKLPTPNGRTGNTWGEKMQFVDDYGLAANDWRSQGAQAGDIVYINTGPDKTGNNWGHVAAIAKVLPNGKILIKESNWREDGKVGTRTIDINSKNIYGVIRGQVKPSFIGDKEESLPTVNRNINSSDFAAAIKQLN